MNILRIVLVVILMTSPLVHSADYKEVSWDDLMPPDWVPVAPEEQEIFDHEAFQGEAFDGDLNPIANIEIAPIVASLDKQKIRIPGYVIPIKFDDSSVSEFLLVPYVGACIHVPPPPENQIVYVSLKKPYETKDLWAPVWVNGIMTAKMSMTEYATAGYHMLEATAEEYEF